MHSPSPLVYPRLHSRHAEIMLWCWLAELRISLDSHLTNPSVALFRHWEHRCGESGVSTTWASHLDATETRSQQMSLHWIGHTCCFHEFQHSMYHLHNYNNCEVIHLHQCWIERGRGLLPHLLWSSTSLWKRCQEKMNMWQNEENRLHSDNRLEMIYSLIN